MGTLIPAYAGQYAFPCLSQYRLVPWYIHDFSQFRQQFIRLRNMFQSKPVTVKIVIHHGGVRFLALGDMRQQSAAAKQVHEGCIVWELLEHLNILLGKHPFLSLKRKRC